MEKDKWRIVARRVAAAVLAALLGALTEAAQPGALSGVVPVLGEALDVDGCKPSVSCFKGCLP